MVAPGEDGWDVFEEGGTVESTHATKEEAEARAQQLAKERHGKAVTAFVRPKKTLVIGPDTSVDASDLHALNPNP
jgi:hypothetical protein